MSSLLGFFLKHLHWLIVLNSLYSFYSDYERHEQQMRSLNAKIPITEIKIKKERRELELIESFKRDLANSRKKVESVASQIEKVQKQLPNTISDPEILEVFSSEAKLINIKKVILRSKREELSGFFYQKEYSFEGTGTYLQFLIFFERLAKRERIFNISELTVKNSKGKQKGRFQTVDLKASLVAYRYNKDHREKSGIREIERKFNKRNRKRPKSRRNRKRK